MTLPFFHKNKTFLLSAALIVTSVVLAYHHIFHAGFLAWDDGEYILSNKSIRHVNTDNIKTWFTTFYVGNYQPLTIFSYAIDFLIGGPHPATFHTSNIVLHCANTCLLYLLLRKLQLHNSVALVSALLFALHPVQTESVSWVAERKTVLSYFFYLLALLQYVTYINKPSRHRMLVVTFLAMCAILCKATAVAIPLSLFAIDTWLQRPVPIIKQLQEKAPLLTMSLTIGIVALSAQKSGDFIRAHNAHTLLHGLIYAGYAYTQYIVRFFAPFALSALYPYPAAPIPLHYFFAACTIAILYLAYLSYRHKWHVLLGGIFFFTANIIFVLQLVPFGEAITADRYMYLASIGIIYPTVYYLYDLLGQRSYLKWGIAFSTIILLLSLTIARNKIWYSDTAFFNALLRTFPNSAVAQSSVGALYMKAGDLAAAEEHLGKAVRIDPLNYKAWHNKGLLHIHQGRPMDALDALNKSIEISGYPKAYLSRALLHQSNGRYQLALADIDHVLSAQPDNARAWLIKGVCMENLGDLKAAIICCNMAITLDNSEPDFFVRRGSILSSAGRGNLAVKDLIHATDLAPHNGETWFYLGVARYRAGLNPCKDLMTAKKLGNKNAATALTKLCK